jgi:serine/threonine protein kinase
MLPNDSILQNRYKIAQLLKTGSMGAVYLAVDARLNSRVAIKEMRLADNASEKDLQQAGAAFAAEAALLANLNHTAIPRAVDYFTENTRQYFVMELVTGQDLAELLRRQRGRLLDAEMVLDWADQILAALEYLHAQKTPIIHRDIKPSNIKINANNQIKLLDFGISKGLALETPSLPQAEASLRMATLEYAPPEQALKACAEWRTLLGNFNPVKTAEFLASKTDARTDLFSFAATVYRLLTAQLPADSFSRACAVWNNNPDPLVPIRALRSEVSPEISAVLMQAMSLAPSDRPASATEMREDLRNLRAPNLTTQHYHNAELEAQIKNLERRLKDETAYRHAAEANWFNLENRLQQQEKEIERNRKFVESASARVVGAESSRLVAEAEVARFKTIVVKLLTELKTSLSPFAANQKQLALSAARSPELFLLQTLFEVRDEHGRLLVSDEQARKVAENDVRVIG